MFKYLIELPRFQSVIALEYDANGLLIALNCDWQTADDKVITFFFQHVPFTTNKLEVYKKTPNVTVKKAEVDISFDRFWELYNNKLDKKTRVEKIWNTLSEIEKLKALAFIPKYENQLFTQGITKKYPSTYLNSRIWE